MASPSKKTISLYASAVKHKHSFIQFAAMTGLLMLSGRCLGQKYKIHALEDQNSDLKEEHKSLSDRISNIKRDLLHEASLDPSGRFASNLRLLFAQDH